MANQNRENGNPAYKEADGRAARAALARITSDDQNRSNKQSATTTTTITTTSAASFKSQMPSSTKTKTSTVSRPKANVEAISKSAVKPQSIPASTTKPAVKSEKGIDTMDLTMEDDTIYSGLADSPSINSRIQKRGFSFRLDDDDEFGPETSVNDLRGEFEQYQNQIRDNAVPNGSEDEYGEGSDDEYEDVEEEDEQVTRRLVTNGIPLKQQAKPATNLQRPYQDHQIAQSVPPKRSAYPQTSTITAVTSLNGNHDRFAQSQLNGQRVHWGQDSPSRKNARIIPLMGSGTPSQTPTLAGAKRNRTTLEKEQSQGQISKIPFFGSNGNRSSNGTLTSEPFLQLETPLPSSSIDTTNAESAELSKMDYTTDALRAMKHSDLQSEPFDKDPQSSGTKLNAVIARYPSFESASLMDRLGMARNLENTEAQSAFFETLIMPEWEEAGDWFMDEFSKLMNRMKEARKERRAVTEKFEEEVSKRHDQVESRIERTGKTMDEMKKRGQQVVMQAYEPSGGPGKGV